MWTAFNTSNNAFNSRIAETVDARNKLQDQLAKVRLGNVLIFVYYSLKYLYMDILIKLANL